MPAFYVHALRAAFPPLALDQAGRPVALPERPGGTQLPLRVTDAALGTSPCPTAHTGTSSSVDYRVRTT